MKPVKNSKLIHIARKIILWPKLHVNYFPRQSRGCWTAIWVIIFLWPSFVYDFSATVARKHVFAGRATAGKYVLSGHCPEKQFKSIVFLVLLVTLKLNFKKVIKKHLFGWTLSLLSLIFVSIQFSNDFLKKLWQSMQ